MYKRQVLLRGKNGYAAEVAHIPLGTPDAVCSYCGNKGCIENDLAQRGMELSLIHIYNALRDINQYLSLMCRK